jgi:hypothetical protein
MGNPYRERGEVLARYPLRAHPAWLGGAAVSVLCVILLSVRLMAYLHEPMLWAVLALVAVAPPIIATRIAHFRVAGGRGELRVYRDRIEVPQPASRAPLILPMAGLSVEVRSVLQGVVNGVRIEEPASLVLRHAGGVRELSAALFVSSDAVERAAREIRQVQEGRSLEEPPVPARDRYDDRLDEELNRLD